MGCIRDPRRRKAQGLVVSSDSEHGRLINVAARSVLGPLGFWQKGRSRVWLADRGFWLCVVEFQPSGYRKGSYLNVAAHWLWGVTGVVSHDYRIERQKPWAPFEDVEQFSSAIRRLALQAGQESEHLRSIISRTGEAATRLVERAESFAKAGRGGGWPAFDAAVALGLSGDSKGARKLFDEAYATISAWRPDLALLIAPFSKALEDPSSFVTFVDQRINARRVEFGLPTLMPSPETPPPV